MPYVEAVAPPPSPGLIRRILVVDDEEPVRSLSQLALERAGFQVLTAGNGTEALQLYATHQRTIDVVVLDLMMPDLTGEQVLTLLRQQDPEVRVVICSAYASSEDCKTLLAAGVRSVVFKPFRIDDLVQAVQQAMS